MAFPNYDATAMTRPAALNGASPYDALTLKKLLGLDILKAFARKIVVSDKIMSKEITQGKTGTFPIMGRASGSYHTAGARVTTKGIPYAEREISVVRPYIAATFCDNFEEAIASFESRGERADALAEDLAFTREVHTMIMLAKASHGVKVLTDGSETDGQWITNDKFKISGESGASTSKAEQAAAIAEALYAANVLMDNKGIPRDGRFLTLRPDEVSNLVHAVQSNGFSLSSTQVNGAPGNIATGGLAPLDGTTILSTPHLPKANLASTEDRYTYYNGDFTKLVGTLFRREAVGLVKLFDTAVESDYDIEYQGNLILAKQCYGLGILRPECAVNLELSTLSN